MGIRPRKRDWLRLVDDRSPWRDLERAFAPEPTVALDVALREVGRPLLEALPAFASPELFARAYGLVARVWNATVACDQGSDTSLFATLHDDLKRGCSLDAERIGVLVSTLATQKRRLFPSDDRVVQRLSIRRHPGARTELVVEGAAFRRLPVETRREIAPPDDGGDASGAPGRLEPGRQLRLVH